MALPADQTLSGHVLLAAIADPQLARSLAMAGREAAALVAIVCADGGLARDINEIGDEHLVAFAPAEPESAETWQRIVAQVEQRLGPIDAAVLGLPAEQARLVRDTVTPDMSARHLGAVLDVEDSTDAGEILQLLAASRFGRAGSQQ